MTDAEIRLECLRIASQRAGNHLADAPAIIADAAAFAGFALGDDEVTQTVDTFRDELARHRSKAAEAEQPAWPIDYRHNSAGIAVRQPDGGILFTGGFRDGPASEP